MKSILSKILSSVLAVVVFFSTVSFTIDEHYCGDQLVSLSVFTKADSCGMEMAEKVSTTEKCNNILKKQCCHNKTQLVKGQNELQTSFSDLTFSQQLFLTSFVYSYINLFEGFDEEVSSLNSYEPDLVVKSIHKLHEVYLI
ncbi:HYC_CC_PP family protein [Neptunitalea lumnitzerae]|uniref:Secreted protein n=1 Tax=Neptunitalea lumnitzerae TaxID=2965509 RepID=A0ABQ5MIQ9_9FLAO|nr:hypothetical protein [Neptunitalea sp. Y10]GLB49306.1 hypothetical protein Y10_16740 [Neptunitalea sp. Y10]